jgi:hypothetical protein
MGKPKKQKQIWGHWKIAEGVFSLGGNRVPFRLMIQLPYDWHLTHKTRREGRKKKWVK